MKVSSWWPFALGVAAIVVGPGMSAAQVCSPNAAGGCRTALQSRLKIRNDPFDTTDRIVWKFSHGQTTPITDFLDPLNTTSYALCIYAGTTQGLIAEAVVPPSNTAWRLVSNRAFAYKDANGAFDGINKVILHEGAADQTKIRVRGSGPALPDIVTPVPPSNLPLTVQLQKSDDTRCWASTFSTTTVNLSRMVKAKSP